MRRIACCRTSTCKRSFDAAARETAVTASGPGFASATQYTYQAHTGCLASITHGGQTATYDWSNSLRGLPSGISYSGAAGSHPLSRWERGGRSVFPSSLSSLTLSL
jgi:hypothetical protein